MGKEIILNISLVKEAEGGYSVTCTDLDIASQGETIEEARTNIKEAIELYFESAKDLGIFDEVLEKLGLENLEEGVNIPEIFKTEIPVNVAV